MIHSPVPPTTHTLEMAQIAELTERIASHVAPPAITAAAIGMTGAPLEPGQDGQLSDDAVLARLSWRGSPEFPDIYGCFTAEPSGPQLRALLHTAALHQLSRLLGVRQRWGIGG